MSCGCGRVVDAATQVSRSAAWYATPVCRGRAAWRRKVYIVYDAQIFEDLGYENRPICLVGADMFAERSVIFDFAHETLYIGPQR